MKYYVVFKGYNPGVYDNWEEVRLPTEGFSGASFKSYETSEEAARAYRNFTGNEDRMELGRLITSLNLNDPGRNEHEESHSESSYNNNPEIDQDAWAVDASCLKNPGKMEYRGVEVRTGKVIFRKGPYEDATNNIGEYLALIHAMALMAKTGEYHNIYSDSATALSWWRKKKVKTTLKQTAANAKVFELLERASTWANTHTFPAKVIKWQTERWGEIPADFGRK